MGKKVLILIFLQSPDFYFYISEKPCAILAECPIFVDKGYLSLTRQTQGVPLATCASSDLGRNTPVSLH